MIVTFLVKYKIKEAPKNFKLSINKHFSFYEQLISCADPEDGGGGGQGVLTLPGKSQSYRVP